MAFGWGPILINVHLDLNIFLKSFVILPRFFLLLTRAKPTCRKKLSPAIWISWAPGFLAGMAEGIGVVLLLSLVVSTTCHFSPPSNGTAPLERSKRALFLLPFDGIFSMVLRLFQMGFDIHRNLEQRHYRARQEERLNQLQSNIEAIQAGLQEIKSAVDELGSVLYNALKRFTDNLEFRSIMGYHAGSLLRLKELVDEFQSLNETRWPVDYFIFKQKRWATTMLDTGSSGAKSVLYNLHLLVIGERVLATEPLFRRFFYTFCFDDAVQSRKWKTEAYGDLVISYQVTLYGLWIKALQIENGTHLSSQIEEVEDLQNKRIQKQLELLREIRQLPNDYRLHRTSNEQIHHATQLCFASPLCFGSGYRIIPRENESSAVTTTCGNNETSSLPEFICRPNGRFDSVSPLFNSRRRFSARLLSVPDPDNQAICRVETWEEQVGRYIYIRQKVSVCRKTFDDGLEVIDTLQSDNQHLRVVPWPYRIVSPEFPHSDGWVTGIGLELNEDKSVEIKMRTDYFPPFVLKNFPDVPLDD